MKKFLILIFAFSLTQANATIEHDPSSLTEPSAQEISKNRACFEELEMKGCGDPGEEVMHFRSCLKDVLPSLTTDCRELMNYLYSSPGS